MNNLEKCFIKGKHFCKKNKGLFSTIGAIAGLGLTIYLTSKATLKVERTLNEVHTPEEVKNVKKTVVKEVAKPVITTAITIFCIVLTYRFGKQTEAGLLSIIAGGNALMKEYRKQMVESGAMSPDEECDRYEAAMNALDEKPLPEKEKYDGYKLYKEELTGEFFFAKPEDILKAEIHLKDGIAYNEYESFWTWLQCLVDSSDTNPDLGNDIDLFKNIFNTYKNGALNCGWCSVGWGSEEKYGYRHVEICQKEMVDEKTGRDYTLIYYPFLPHADYEDIDLCDDKEYTVVRLMKG